MDMKKRGFERLLTANNTLKITYHLKTSKKNVFIYFTGSTMSELIKVVEQNNNPLPPRDVLDPDCDMLDLYWFEDEGDQESKIEITNDDGVKIFMERTSGFNPRQLHVRPWVQYSLLENL